MKTKKIFVLIFLVCISVVIVYGSEKRVVKPITTWEDWTPMEAEVWIAEGLDSSYIELIQLAYLQGFLDAVAFCEMGSQILGKWSSECEGMDIVQLRDTMNKFYGDYPHWRDSAPSTVLAVAIPRLRKGLQPFPPEGIEK